jgi:hypothetical protein
VSTEPASPEEVTAEKWRDAFGYEEQAVHEAAKRCGVQWSPWMGDWFTSWSPRNDNSNAEGTWDHWVDLALKILADPLTALVRPDVHDPSLTEKTQGFYDESNRRLTYAELRARFDTTAVSSPPRQEG